jgi:hypothetical protein
LGGEEAAKENIVIVANLVHLAEQVAMSPALRKAVDFLRRAEGQTLPPRAGSKSTARTRTR